MLRNKAECVLSMEVVAPSRIHSIGVRVLCKGHQEAQPLRLRRRDIVTPIEAFHSKLHRLPQGVGGSQLRAALSVVDESGGSAPAYASDKRIYPGVFPTLRLQRFRQSRKDDGGRAGQHGKLCFLSGSVIRSRQTASGRASEHGSQHLLHPLVHRRRRNALLSLDAACRPLRSLLGAPSLAECRSGYSVVRAEQRGGCKPSRSCRGAVAAVRCRGCRLCERSHRKHSGGFDHPYGRQQGECWRVLLVCDPAFGGCSQWRGSEQQHHPCADRGVRSLFPANSHLVSALGVSVPRIQRCDSRSSDYPMGSDDC